MKVYLEKENKDIEILINGERKLIDVLKELDISVESIILVKNDEICLEDDFVTNSDDVKILSVVSGG